MILRPSILFIGGHDPSGGAGIQADIETAAALGCRSYSLVTCLTTQNTQNIASLQAQSVAAFNGQFDLLLNDIEPDIIKIGLLGDAALSHSIAERLAKLKKPIVLDPVLAAGGGQRLAQESLIESIRNELIPIATVITPNRTEARQLSQQESLTDSAAALLELGAEYVFITGADEASIEVTNTLYANNLPFMDFTYPLLPHTYHGSGCTLASATACNLVLGKRIEHALADAQHFTWQALENAETPGKGQHLPKRL